MIHHSVLSSVRLAKRSAVWAIVLFGAIAWSTSAVSPERKWKTEAEAMLWRMGELCMEEGVYLSGSGNCVNCHAPDSAGAVLVDEHGGTVSPVVDWQATMMANSARDPFWKAQVAFEVLTDPSHQDEIETTCVRCHAPQGHYEAMMTGAAEDGFYTMEDLAEDELGLDGVGCTGCHTIDDDDLAGRSNGDLPINTQGIAWGAFENPWDGLMSGQTGYIPGYGEHFKASEVCAPCHSLYTHTRDLDGEETGDVFFEQATYLEWLNSAYNGENVQCQSCHMPLVSGGTPVSTQPNWLFSQRFGRHHFVGGNSFMLQLMRDNAVVLDLSASSVQYDSTIARTIKSLTHATATLHLHQSTPSSSGLAAFDVVVENLAGHKFPSGYPSRLAFLEFALLTSSGDTLFHSGQWSAEDGIAGRDVAPATEPHWDHITSPAQVQIYEFAFADVSGAPSTLLERAASVIKDNRLPPRGFTTAHAAYDTVRIGPMASLDSNFNRALPDGTDGSEGAGMDRVRYEIDLQGYTGSLRAEASLHYVSVPARYVAPLFDEASEDSEIASFRAMFEDADRTPVLVAQATKFGFTHFDEAEADWLLVPNPAPAGTLVRLSHTASASGAPVIDAAWLVDGMGRTLEAIEPTTLFTGFPPHAAGPGNGTYFVRIALADGSWKTLKGLATTVAR